MQLVLFGQTPGFWLTLLSNYFPCGALIAASTSVCNTNRIQQRAGVLHVWNQVRGKPQKIQALVGNGDAIGYLVQRRSLCGPSSLRLSLSVVLSLLILCRWSAVTKQSPLCKTFSLGGDYRLIDYQSWLWIGSSHVMRLNVSHMVPQREPNFHIH